MPVFSTPAILLRHTDYGDYDRIVTCFTRDRGKISFIAKSAKKSSKRFAGILELFSVLHVVGSTGRGKGLPVLQEAVLKHPFSGIRADIKKTAYASYWAELIDVWMEADEKQVELFHLLHYVLSGLDRGNPPPEVLSILFQMRLIDISGYQPNLKRCSRCQNDVENLRQSNFAVDLKGGGIICVGCAPEATGRLSLSKGTIKQLLWVARGELAKAARIRFTPQAQKEGLEFLEAFVPFHLGKQPRSLKFLQQIRT